MHGNSGVVRECVRARGTLLHLPARVSVFHMSFTYNTIGPQLLFDRVPGVVHSSVGYTCGRSARPTYEQVREL